MQSFVGAGDPVQRNIKREFSSKSDDDLTFIDAFTKNTGYEKKKEPNSKQVIHNVLLEPENGNEDSEKLNIVMNNPNVRILKYESNWDMHGNLRIFLLYSEKITLKEGEQ